MEEATPPGRSKATDSLLRLLGPGLVTGAAGSGEPTYRKHLGWGRVDVVERGLQIATGTR
jgi:hypothetical protein